MHPRTPVIYAVLTLKIKEINVVVRSVLVSTLGSIIQQKHGQVYTYENRFCFNATRLENMSDLRSVFFRFTMFCLSKKYRVLSSMQNNEEGIN